MKRTIGLAFTMLLGVTLLASPAWAQGEGSEGAEVTQLELADILVNVMGLSRFLPGDPTAQERFAALMTNGVVPEGGWKADEVVTKAVLARVVVQAMGRANEVENPKDPASWVAFARSGTAPSRFRPP